MTKEDIPHEEEEKNVIIVLDTELTIEVISIDHAEIKKIDITLRKPEIRLELAPTPLSNIGR